MHDESWAVVPMSLSQLRSMAGLCLWKVVKLARIRQTVGTKEQNQELQANNTTGTDMLTAPPVTSTLQYLAIGKGIITYTCANRTDTEAPLYVQEETYLYDVAPLILKFSSEAQFHSYVPRFLEYDYISIDNSSLNCIGTVQTISGISILDLYNVDAFPVEILEVVNAPDNSQFDLQWAHSKENSNEWEIYRVVTAGGGSPYDCGDQIINDDIPSEYVAEYWFYQNKANHGEGR